ncbi:MAG: hypothetical protein CMC22_02070 [Flavobacteriaceae bacterium]|nr:hypothetical protein [Flavobacteriaceae bacterium]|tara:strand:- start:1382 stop:1726 length:345 start_codon:yes stop_codon:yes gene_type:complete
MDCGKHKRHQCRLGANKCYLGLPHLKRVLILSPSRKPIGEPIDFDQKRHKDILNLPIDYPRINQFPEWFTLDPKNKYHITASQKNLSGNYRGERLIEGMAVKLSTEETLKIVVE